MEIRDNAEATKAYGARMRALRDRGEKLPHRAVQLIHGDLAGDAMSNTARGVKQGTVVPIEVLCRKPG